MATLAQPGGLAVADCTSSSPSSATGYDVDESAVNKSPDLGPPESDTSKHKSLSRSSSQSSNSHGEDVHVGSDRFRDSHCYPLEYSEDAPLFNHANGRINSSQEDSECEGGVERVIAGEGALNGSSSLKAYSSASGDGSSIWSGDDGRERNEQGSPHYGLLNSGTESELSSPGETPDPVPVAMVGLENPLSLGDNGTPLDTASDAGMHPSISDVVDDEVAAVPYPEDVLGGPVALPDTSPSSSHDPSTTTCKNEDSCIQSVTVGDTELASTDGAPVGVDVNHVTQDQEESDTIGSGENEQGRSEVSEYVGELSEGGEEVEHKSVVLDISESTLPGAPIVDVPQKTTEDGDRELEGNNEEVVTESDSPVDDVPVEYVEGEERERTEQEVASKSSSVTDTRGVSVEEEGGELIQEVAAVTSSDNVMPADTECEGRERSEQQVPVASESSSVDGITPAADREREEMAATPSSGDVRLTDTEGEGREGTEQGATNETTANSSSSPAVLIHTSSMVEAALAPEEQSGVGNPELRQTSEDGVDNSVLESNLDSGVREPVYINLDSSNLDSGVRQPSDDLDSSNLDTGVRRPASSNPPVLQPLSPDPDLNEQYEYLRRTLSHSRRRYSTRRRRPHRRAARNDEGQTSDDEVRSEQQQHTMRDMLQGQQQEQETLVDAHGRTYYMDHRTHTMAFEQGRRPPSDMTREREHLERRYLSLQRSFRGQRPTRFAHANLSPIASSPSTPTDLSLSLTRAEAESLSQQNSPAPFQSGASQTARPSKRSKSGRWRFWQRSWKTVSQSRGESSGDDILPVSPGWEGSPPPAVTETGEVIEREREGGRRRREGARERSRRERREVRSGSTEEGDRSSGSRSSDATLTGSVAGTSEEGEGEAVQDQVRQLATGEEVLSGGSSEVVSNGDVGRGEGEGQVREREGRREGDEVFTEVAAQQAQRHSIMRATGMAQSDRNAALQARHRVRATTVRSRRRERQSSRRDTDEETNEELAQVHASSRSPEAVTPHEEEEEEEKEEDKEPPTPTATTPLPTELLNSPALQFITRRDLYSFLSNAGEAGEMFFANRGIMELVQRIRTNNNLFAKYQHSRQLVAALNRFADIRADLPQGWEKKLNREGKVFFIDHDHCMTSFIDPRLPLPDHEFTYTTSTPSTNRPQQEIRFGEEAPLRSHHTTVMNRTVSPPPTTPPSVSVSSPQPPQDTEMTYERQVVSFFRHPQVYQKITQRYQRGVRPQLCEIIEDVRSNGTPALERIQTSGSVAAYELALVLSLFEEEISAINTMVYLTEPQPARDERNTNGPLTVSTLQRKKEAFSTKLQNFKVMMTRLGFAQSSRLKFNIRRDHLLEDSYEHVMRSDIRHLQRKRLNIAFRGEDGLDYGGPSREFFFLLSREIFNPYYGLFEYSANDTYTVQISPTSMFIQNNMDWFRFAGRVIGLVIVQGFLLDVFFTRTIYKALANRAPSLKDLESLEPAFHSSLLWILENDPEPLDLTFTVEEEAFGQLSTHELKEGGMDIPVTNDNKEEYIHLMLRWRLDRGITSQMNMLKKGFSEVMPVSLLQAFDASELEFLTAGTLEIDVEDWKNHTEYRNGYHATHPVILFFWQAVEMFDNEQRLRLLQFVTGTSSVPFEGFKALRGSNGPKRFTIDFFSDVNSLPRTHTCFNRIDLPPYQSYDILYHKLLTAIEEGNTFGIE